MGKLLDDSHIIRATRIKSERKPEESTHRNRAARDLTTAELKTRLCSCGPLSCPDCKLCEFGKEYMRRPNDEKEANTMFFQITCSSCGHRSRKLPYNGTTTPEKIIKSGWNSFGSAFYCPKCVKTWEKRNGKDRPLWGNAHTIDIIQRQMIRELNQAISEMQVNGL